VPGYERWARSSRHWVEVKRDTRPTDQLHALNVSAKAAFESLSRRYDSMERERDENKKVQQQNEKAMSDQLSKLQETVDTLQNGMASIILLLQQGNNNPPAAAAAPPAPPTAAPAPQEGTLRFCHFFHFFQNLTIIVLSLAVPTPPTDVNEGLLSTGRLPVINSTMPTTFVKLLNEWVARGLEDYRTCGFKNSHNLGQAYRKRKYMYDKVVERRVSHGLPTLMSAAITLDVDKGRQNLANYYKALHAADNSIVRRRKRSRGDETPPRQVIAAPPAPDPLVLPPLAERRAARAAETSRLFAAAANRRVARGNNATARRGLSDYDRNWRERLSDFERRELNISDAMMTPHPPTAWERSGHTSGNRFGQDNEY
jgi:hypothetical protein